MSFTIDLCQTASPNNKVNKTIDVINQVNGQLRKGTSIIDPVIIVVTDNNFRWRKGLNYAYIPEFGRYYYVTNILAVYGTYDAEGPWPDPAQFWELHMHVDVLMSYKDEILAQTAIVARQESTYNLMLDDGSFMTYQNPKIQTKLFSNAAPFETQEFVLVVAGS